jgi:hypothetical protein
VLVEDFLHGQGGDCSVRPVAGSFEPQARRYTHVADLHLVGDAAEGDDGPVLKFSMM